MKVLMVQFIKGSWHYGELEAARMLGEDRFKILPMGRGFVKLGAEKPHPEDIRLAQEAWEFARENILGGQYDLVILDEINYVISYKMLDPGVVVEALKKKPEMVHVILTGRNAHPSIGTGRHGHRNAGSEASLPEGNLGPKGNRVLRNLFIDSLVH